MRRTLAAIILLCLGTVANARAQAPASKSADASPARSADLQVVLLGTGFPRPYPDRAGPSTLVIANGKYFVVDAGRGVMMRLASLGQPVRRAPNLVMPGMPRVEAVLLTHLHPDHTSGLPDLFISAQREPAPLELFGPEGLQDLVEGMLRFYAFEIRLAHQLQYAPDARYTFNPHKVNEGVIYEKGGVRIIAFAVDHRPVEPAFGYRFEVADKAVVISGDTGLTPNLVKYAKGADILVHEVYEPGFFDPKSYLARYHTDAEQVGKVASEASVRQLVLTHIVPPEHSEHIRELAAKSYKGPITVGKDLMRFSAVQTP